jgi:formylglycine-generating enzyme required for sulfatase activity
MRGWIQRTTWIIGLLLAAAPVAAQEGGLYEKSIARERTAGTKWALLIGVNEYLNVASLKYSVADIQALRRQLVATGFAADHVLALTDDGEHVRNRPLKKNIDRHLNGLLGTLNTTGDQLLAPGLVERGDLVVIAFSGHGVHLDGTSYLCPTDTDLDDAATLVSVERIYRQLELCGASVKLVIVDACRNDPRRDGSKGFDRSAEAKSLSAAFDSPPSGILVMSSCAPGQRSWEDTQLAHGVFMNFVVDGLGGAADTQRGNRDHLVSLLELYSYAAEKTKTHVAGMMRRGLADGAQTPRLRGEIEGDFSFGVVGPLAFSKITNSIGMELVLIPRGEFVMGARDRTAFADELPAHPVRLTHNFYLGAHEVTVGQFRRFVAETKYRTDAERDARGGWGWCNVRETFVHGDRRFSWKHNGYADDENQPVANVSWNDAVAFCQWLSAKERTLYHLPSEAQWEYACRAGTTSRFSFGDDAEHLALYGNIADGTASERFQWPESIRARDGYAFIAPVGSFKPNPWGLFDMHGNVQEWCGDGYGENYYQQLAGRTAENPTGSADPLAPRVVRGGSWSFESRLAESSHRYNRAADAREDRIGFRIARMP